MGVGSFVPSCDNLVTSRFLAGVTPKRSDLPKTEAEPCLSLTRLLTSVADLTAARCSRDGVVDDRAGLDVTQDARNDLDVAVREKGVCPFLCVVGEG